MRKAFEKKSARVYEAVFDCHIQVTQEQLGKTCGILGKRRAKIIDEQLKYGTSIFGLRALLPVAESFGFYGELVEVTR